MATKFQCHMKIYNSLTYWQHCVLKKTKATKLNRPWWEFALIIYTSQNHGTITTQAPLSSSPSFSHSRPHISSLPASPWPRNRGRTSMGREDRDRGGMKAGRSGFPVEWIRVDHGGQECRVACWGGGAWGSLGLMICRGPHIGTQQFWIWESGIQQDNKGGLLSEMLLIWKRGPKITVAWHTWIFK